VPVTDEQMAALRAHLALRPDEFKQHHETLVRNDDLAGYGELIFAAFVMAARRRFVPSWTVPDIIGFVVAARIRLREAGIDIDPRTSEALLRRALGEDVSIGLDEAAVGRAQIFLLGEMVIDEQLDDVGLDEFLERARDLADGWLTS
jgi:hypothetical protein